MIEKAVAKLPKSEETIGFLLTKNESTNVFRVYAGDIRESTDGKKSHKLLLMIEGDADDILEAESNLILNEERLKIDEDWIGEKMWNKSYEGDDALKEAAQYRQFHMLFPAMPSVETPLAREDITPKKLTDERRKELVARFGEAAIAELEARQNLKK